CCRSSQRVQCLVAFSFVTGIFSFLGALCGGFLLNNAPPLLGFRIPVLFLVSSILRLTADLIISGSFSETRKDIKHVSSWDLFMSIIGLKPIEGSEKTIEQNF
ncbi:MAG TPA: hypothetical protein PLU24_05770, partial [Candidatus Omnitrophota bacterium]|nr:hypothetical protein [Candidatus Omnitrophota bacterium]